MAGEGEPKGELLKEIAELRYKVRVLSQLDVGINIVGPDDGIILHVNPQFEAMLGYDPGELVGSHISVVNAPGEKPPAETADEIMRCLSDTGHWSGEVRNIRKDGSIVWCHAKVVVVDHLRYGEVYASVHEDITARRRAEEKLRESEERFRVMAESSHDLLTVADEQGNILWANKAWQETLGDTPETQGDPIGRIHPDDRMRVLEAFHAVGDDESAFTNVAYRYRTASGEYVALEATVRRRLVGGEPVLYVLAHDVTGRRRAEEALRESEEKYRSIFQAAASLIISIDRDGTIVACNDRVREFLGYTPDELIGQPMGKMIHPGHLARARDCLRRTASTGHVDGEEYGMVRKDGSVLDVQIDSAAQRDRDGSFLRTVCIASDITERKRAAEKTRAALREKEALLREVRHRVKNNLQVISSLLDMSSLRTEDRRALELFADARTKIHTIALIHSQVYQSERFDSVEMGPHVRELVDYLREVYAGSERVRTTVEVGDVRLSVAQAIPCALVLTELISNALKHAFTEGQEGEITILLRRSAEDTILAKVSDNGVGMPDDVDVHKASTLGLKLVGNLVQKQLKGRVQVRVEGGTEVAVRFPFHAGREATGCLP